MGEQAQDQSRNEVALVGRVSGIPEERELPSGDLLVVWRVVVDRPPSRRPVPDGARVTTTDTFDCVAWTAGLRRTAGALASGDVVQVEGAQRRRFWQGATGPASKCEVEVSRVKRLTRSQPSR